MKALQLHEVGSLEGLQWNEIQDPEVGEHDVLVKIKATSLNYRDYGFITGAYPIMRKLPIVLGSDAAGVVERVGDKVTQFAPGDKVISLLRQDWSAGRFTPAKAARQLGGTVPGVFSEWYSFTENSLVKAPTTLTLEEAATLPTAGLVAFRALTQSGLVSGQRVLIQGTGGVSLFALQLAVGMGLEVWITSSNSEKEEMLRVMGAHHVINYRNTPQWDEEILKQTAGQGVDLVMEVVGGKDIQKSVNAVALGGTIAIVGFLNGSEANVNLIKLILKNIQLKGFTTGSREDLQDLVRWLETNPVKPVIGGVYSDYFEGFKAFENRSIPGKVIVKF